MNNCTQSQLRRQARRLSEIPSGQAPISTGLQLTLVESGLSPEAISAKSRVSPSTVRRFMLEGRSISLDNADKLAEAFGIEWTNDG